MKWLAKLIGLENKFSPFFGLPSLLFPRLHWRKCIKIGGDRNSISWQCFAIVYLIYLQIVPFLEFARKINCHCLTFNPYHFDSKGKAKKVYLSLKITHDPSVGWPSGRTLTNTKRNASFL